MTSRLQTGENLDFLQTYSTVSISIQPIIITWQLRRIDEYQNVIEITFVIIMTNICLVIQVGPSIIDIEFCKDI